MSLILSQSSRPKSTKIVIQKPSKGKGRKSRPRRRNRRPGGQMSSGHEDLTTCFYKSLVDPFEYTGCRLGWGCMVPSMVTQAYLRTNVSANADGSLCVLALPSVTASLLLNNAGAAVATWTSVNALDRTAVNANFSTGRIISYGIRVAPSISMTQAPGFIYAGALPYATYDAIALMTPNDFIGIPTSKACGVATGGASATGRPISVQSFEFSNLSTDLNGYTNVGATSNVVVPNSVPYIVMQGCPASCQVNVEVCINIECLTKIAGGGTNGITTGMDNEPTLSNVWSTPSALWRYLSSQLPTPGRAFQQIASFDAAMGGAPSKYLKQIITNYGYRSANFNYANQRLLR